MSLYTRARKHIDMKRVKEMREEKIREEVIAELERQQQEILADLKEIESQESKSCDWRKELHERMTSSGTLFTTLPATGDVDIINTSTTYSDIHSIQNDSRSGNTITLQGTENQIVNGEHTYFNVARFTVDGTKVSHVKITISKGGGTSSWTDRDPAESFNDDVTLNINDADNFLGAPSYNNTNLTSGTHIIPLPGNYKRLRISFEQFGKVGATGALRITNVSLQRRTPVSVFVGLDDPNSAAFVRDGDFERLSPAEKKKKLEEQLKASDEYLKKQFGEGMPRTATQIADAEVQKSFYDQQYGLKPGQSMQDRQKELYQQQYGLKSGQSRPGSFMDIKAGGQRITKRDGRTITDTTRGIKDGKMDGKPIRSSTPTPKSVSQPDKQPVKGVPFTGLSPEDLKSISDRVGGSYSGTTGKTNPKTTLSNPLKSGVDKATLEKNIEASLKQLEIDNEQLKGDALKRNIGLAADLGLDILTAVTLLTPIPGDEAAALSVQAAKAGVKTGAKNVSQKAVQTSLKKNAYNNIADDVADDAARWTADLLMNKARYGDDALKYVNKLENAASSGNTSAVQKIVKEIERLDPLRRFNKPSVPKPSVPKPSPRTNPGGAYPRNSPMRPKNTPQGTLGNSYQPQGKVLTEKKRLKSPKSIVDKIPGYYDGKPAPLGFPIEEPPKMKNGYHPDLVDGKKVSNRYNRLDPISAKSMPPTGNPHIDKKVKAARKKPK